MLKTAIISFEHMHAWGYASALMESPLLEFTAYVEKDPERYEKIRKKFPSAKAYHSREQMLADGGFDAVIVTSANKSHKQDVLDAAAAGKHALCEKPIATTVKSARAMIDSCKKAGVKIMTAFPVRYSPAVKRAAKILRSNSMGKILAVNATNHGSMPGGWFVDKKLSGGGAIIDHTVHVADLVRYLLSEEIVQVYAEKASKLHNIKVEDCGLLMMQTSRGTFISLDASWSRPPSYKIWGDVTMKFKGEKANLSVDCFPRTLNVYDNRTMHHDAVSEGENLDLMLVEDFARSVLEDKPPFISGEDGLKAMETALGAYRAIREKQPVTLPLA